MSSSFARLLRLLPSAALLLARCGGAPAGTESGPGFVPAGDGVAAFRLGVHEATTAAFAAFVEHSGYRTDAERHGWSLVFHPPGAAPEGAARVPGASWWVRVEGADWRTPRGPAAPPAAPDHPVTQVGWNDAAAFCAAAGGRLPTPAEWERAARGGLEGARFAWGDDPPFAGPSSTGQAGPSSTGPSSTGPPRANLWDGLFPHPPPGNRPPADGFPGLAPVGSFPANAYGLHDLTGNAWEWTGGGEPGARPLRGGSFLCAANSCRGYRLDWVNRAPADSAWDHTGFRCRFPAGARPGR